jgi:hypothetical protein
VAANAVYEVRCSVDYNSSSASAGIKYDFQLPSGVMNYTAARTATAYNPGFGGNDYTAQVVAADAGTPDAAITQPASTEYGIQVMGLLTTGGSAGTFGLKWSQNASSGSNLTVEAGSYLILTRIA